jgi:hypothetical protein
LSIEKPKRQTMKTLVVEYDGKRVEKQIQDTQFGAYNNAYRKQIEGYYRGKLGITSETEDLASELLGVDSKENAAIVAAGEKIENLRKAMKSINIYAK